MLGDVILAIALFASTNIDDLFVLIGFLANPKFRATQVVIGQYVGIAALVAVSLLLSLASLMLTPAYVGFLGVLPIAIGCKKLLDLRREDDAESHTSQPGFGNVLAVAAVTVANGGDNIGIYTPVFATETASGVVITVLVFGAMVAIWLLCSHWLVNHPALGAPIRRFGGVITPLVLIVIGVLVLYEAGSFSVLAAAYATPVLS